MPNSYLKTISAGACALWLLLIPAAGASDNETRAAMDYDLPMESYKPRLRASDPSGWHPVACPVTVPDNGVELPEGSLFRTALERNTSYLLNSFTVDHMLHPFRIRHGDPIPPEKRAQVEFWDTDLRGANAGRFMMGAGNTLLWIEHAS